MKKLLLFILILICSYSFGQYTITDNDNTITVDGGGDSFTFGKSETTLSQTSERLIFTTNKRYAWKFANISSPSYSTLDSLYLAVKGYIDAYNIVGDVTGNLTGNVTGTDWTGNLNVSDTLELSAKGILFSDGSTQTTSTSSYSHYGEVYTVDNVNATTIDAQDQWHALNNDISEGYTDGFTYQAGISGTMASAATGDSGDTVRFTDVAHGLSVGDYITTVGTTDYNGILEVVRVNTVDIFSILDTWVSDQSGTWDRGTCLTCDAGAAGFYRGNWAASGISETINHVFDFAPCKNITISTKAKARRKFSNVDYGCFSGVALMEVSVGDKIFFIVQNTTGTGNVTIRTRDLNLVKIK